MEFPISLYRTLSFIFLIRICFSLHYKLRSEEEKLLEHLFKDYNPSARPVLNSSDTVTVKIHFSLLQIQDLNVRSQVFATTGLIMLEWKDERMTWNRETESPLDQVVVDAKGIWRPEFAIINGAESIYQDFSEFQAIIYPSGVIRWEPGGVFKTMCQIDITYYPFDEQKCDLVFGAWSYYTSKMNLTTNHLKIIKDSYENNGEWDLLDTGVERKEFFFDCCPDQKFSNVVFTIYLRRRHTFYIMNVILPGILTSAVLLSLFFCTPQQKVHIGVASLLSFRLFLLNVADTIPRTSDHVPLLGIYLTCTMAITTMAMLATVFVLNLYNTKDKPVPNWAKKLFIVYLSRVLCMCNCIAPKPHNIDDENRINDRINKPKEFVLRGGDLQRLLTSQSVEHRRPSGLTMEPHTPPTPTTPLTPHLDFKGGTKKKEKVDYSKDWLHVAAVFDRFFFWLCLLFIIITTLILFHPLTTSKLFNSTEETESGT